jgi:hypothetical protein
MGTDDVGADTIGAVAEQQAKIIFLCDMAHARLAPTGPSPLPAASPSNGANMNGLLACIRFSSTSPRKAGCASGEKPSIDTVTRPHLEAFGERIGIPRPAIALAFRQLQAGTQAAAAYLAAVPGEGPQDFMIRFEQIVSAGCHRILDA